MKRRVVYSKENKRSLRWLQAAGQCKAPFTVIIDLSFARAIVREATSSTPSLKQIAIPHFDGNATKLMNDKLEVPCRVVVTAATMQAADKFRNEVRENQQPKQQKYHQNNNNDSDSKAQQASSALSSQKEKKADPGLNNETNNNNAIYNKKNYVEEDYRMANDVRAFLKSCELWSPPPQEMDVNGPGKEHKAIAESVLFGRPGLEVRPANAKVPHHGVIVATHNPDTKNEIVSAIGRFGVKSEVAVCVMRCLSKPFALRLDPLNDQSNASSNTRGGASSSSSSTTQAQQHQQQQQQPLSHRALADLHFIKKLKDQNLISNNKANYVVTKLSGGSSSAAAMMAAKNNNNNSTSKPGEDAAAAGDNDGDDLKKIREVVVEQEKKNKELVQAAREKFMNKKAKKEIPASSSVAAKSVSKATTAASSSSKHSNPLATKKKQVRVPLKVSKN